MRREGASKAEKLGAGGLKGVCICACYRDASISEEVSGKNHPNAYEDKIKQNWLR